MAFIEDILCARKALAASFDNSELHTFVWKAFVKNLN
jgi:hypothetical protein